MSAIWSSSEIIFSLGVLQPVTHLRHWIPLLGHAYRAPTLNRRMLVLEPIFEADLPSDIYAYRVV